MTLFQNRAVNKKLIHLRLVFVLATLLIIGCRESQSKPLAPLLATVIPSASTTPGPVSATPARSQTFTIISAYEGMDAYVEAAQTTPNANLSALYRQYVVDPYWVDCASGGEYTMLARNAVAVPIKDLNYLARAVNILRESGVEQIVNEALQEASLVLPGPDTTVCIYVVDPKLTFVRDYMGGVTAMTIGAGKIWIQIYPEGIWRDWVPYAVAHEYHHSVWTDRYQDRGFDLVDYLIFEGRADSFAHAVYPEMVAPWTEALTAEQEAAQWQAMQQHLDSSSVMIQRKFMFGGTDVPRWTGYTIGFHIVQTYLKKHPNVSIDEWTALDAHDLLAESDYNAE